MEKTGERFPAENEKSMSEVALHFIESPKFCIRSDTATGARALPDGRQSYTLRSSQEFDGDRRHARR